MGGGGLGNPQGGQPNPNQLRPIWQGTLHLAFPSVGGQPPKEVRAAAVATAGETAVASG